MGLKQYVLQTDNLSKSFRKFEVLHDIDISIKQGEVYGLIGQNGAGKTTLLRLISGLMKPTKGSVKLKTEKTFVGYMPQSCRFDDSTTVAETIRFFARIRNVDVIGSSLLAEKMELDMTKKVKHLSPGQQKKLQMIVAMTGEPDFYILDEPTAGLDPNAAFEMKNIIKSIHNNGKSIIISSHILQDMDEICTNIAIMESGRITYNDVIESCYIIKTSFVSNQSFKTLTVEYPVVVDDFGTTLTAKISREQVPKLISALNLQKVDIYEVTASNVKSIVDEHLHLTKGVQQ